MKLHFQQYGSGKPLIILHGLFGMSDNWVSLARKYADDFQVFVVDQRNHGRSGHHPVFNYAAMVDDLHELMEEQQLPSASLLGHSMGGKTVMQFAFDYPAMVEKLIVADISADAYNHGHDVLIDAMLAVDLDGLNSRSEVDEELKKLIPNEPIRLFLLKNLHWKDRSTLGWKANLEVIQANLPEVFRALNTSTPFEGETLFIRGSESPYIQQKHIPRLKKLFRNSRIETIEGASHWLHAEYPGKFFSLSHSFLLS